MVSSIAITLLPLHYLTVFYYFNKTKKPFRSLLTR